MSAAGILINGKHTFSTFRLKMLRRSIGSAPKDDHTERVPFSSVTYDFDVLYGASSYGERTLKYTFDFIETDRYFAEYRLRRLREWLHWQGRMRLHDDMLPSHYFSVREPDVQVDENHGVYTVTMTFKAAPEMHLNPECDPGYITPTVCPDVNGDGAIDSSDAAMILSAYAKIQAGDATGGFKGVYRLTAEQPSDWTENYNEYFTRSGSGTTDDPYVYIANVSDVWVADTYYKCVLTIAQQLERADANEDGAVDSSDAALVLRFYSCHQSGEWADMTDDEAWAAFRNGG